MASPAFSTLRKIVWEIAVATDKVVKNKAKCDVLMRVSKSVQELLLLNKEISAQCVSNPQFLVDVEDALKAALKLIQDYGLVNTTFDFIWSDLNEKFLAAEDNIVKRVTTLMQMADASGSQVSLVPQLSPQARECEEFRDVVTSFEYSPSTGSVFFVYQKMDAGTLSLMKKTTELHPEISTHVFSTPETLLDMLIHYPHWLDSKSRYRIVTNKYVAANVKKTLSDCNIFIPILIFTTKDQVPAINSSIGCTDIKEATKSNHHEYATHYVHANCYFEYALNFTSLYTVLYLCEKFTPRHKKLVELLLSAGVYVIVRHGLRPDHGVAETFEVLGEGRISSCRSPILRIITDSSCAHYVAPYLRDPVGLNSKDSLMVYCNDGDDLVGVADLVRKYQLEATDDAKIDILPDYFEI